MSLDIDLIKNGGTRRALASALDRRVRDLETTLEGYEGSKHYNGFGAKLNIAEGLLKEIRVLFDEVRKLDDVIIQQRKKSKQ